MFFDVQPYERLNQPTRRVASAGLPKKRRYLTRLPALQATFVRGEIRITCPRVNS